MTGFIIIFTPSHCALQARNLIGNKYIQNEILNNFFDDYGFCRFIEFDFVN